MIQAQSKLKYYSHSSAEKSKFSCKCISLFVNVRGEFFYGIPILFKVYQ